MPGEQIAASDVAGFDETGFRVDGRLHWVHCARIGKYTLLMVHPRRGKQAIEAMGVLPSFGGVAVHDAWAPYDTYTAAGHQLCCAHARRELQAVTDWPPRASGAGPPRPPKRSPRCKSWSARRSPGPQRRGPGRAGRPDPRLPLRRPDRGQPDRGPLQQLMKKHHALARRLLDRQDDYLRFTRDCRVPPDNNGTERDIRMTKLRQKVSGCLRTLTGARQFCAIRSYLSTAAKHGLSFFDALVMLAEGEPWTPTAA